MLLSEPTPEMIAEWKAVFAEYKNRLRPNKRPSRLLIDYIAAKYPVTEEKGDVWREIVIDNILSNPHLAKKLPPQAEPAIRVFKVLDELAAKKLYLEQDEVYKGLPIVVGIESHTGFFYVEGSSALWDELLAFSGLDQDDLENFYLVAEYVNCVKRFGKLDDVVSGS